MVLSAVLSGLILFILAKYHIFDQIGSTAVIYLIIGLIVSTIIGTFLAFPVGHFLLKPLNQLIHATRQVSKGNFDVKAKEIMEINKAERHIRGGMATKQKYKGT